MTARSTRFQVQFEVGGDGQVKASIDSVAQSAVDAGAKANAAGKEWEEFGNRIGTAMRFAGITAAAGIALIVKNTIEAERELAQLDAVLRSTGNAAGYSRDQLVAMADGVAAASTFSAGEVIKAETRLLSYSGVVGKNFPQALQIAIDQAARLGIGVEQSAETIGRALESPTKAAAALAQQGFGAAFTSSVRQAIKDLEAAGDAAGAQQIVIDILNESYQGAAAAARDTLGGALVSLKNTLADVLTGDTGGEGLKGTQQAVEDLIATLNSAEVRDGFASMTEGAFGLLNGLALLIGKANEARLALQDLLTIQLGGFSGAQGGEAIAKQQAELKLVEAEQARRAQGGVLGAARTASQIFGGAGGRLIGAEGIQGSTGSELEERRRALQRGIESNRNLFGDPSRPRIIEGTMLPDRVLRPVVTPGATDPSKPAPDRSNTRIKQAKAELSEFEKLMSDIAVYEGIWADSAVDASNAKVDAWEAENEARHRRNEVADRVLQDIQLETEAMGMSNEQLEIRNNLLYAGVTAESDRGQAIIEATKALQQSRETFQVFNDLQSITTDLGESVIMSFGDAGDAVEEFGERLQRMAARMLAEKAVQYLFGLFMGGTGAGNNPGSTADLYSGAWGFSEGGRVHGPGTPTSDSITARLSRDEFVVKAASVRKYGLGLFEDLNAGRFAAGGVVGSAGTSSVTGVAWQGAAGVTVQVINNTDGTARSEESIGPDGGRMVKVIIDAAVGEVTRQIGQMGGVGKAIGARFAMQPAGVARG